MYADRCLCRVDYRRCCTSPIAASGGTPGIFATACVKENRGRGSLAALTPGTGRDGGDRRIAALAHQQADGDDDLAVTTVEFKPALRSVRQMGCVTGQYDGTYRAKSAIPLFPTLTTRDNPTYRA